MFLKNFKSRLCSSINIDFLQFLCHICQNIHFTKIFMKEVLYIFLINRLNFLYIFEFLKSFKPLLWTILFFFENALHNSSSLTRCPEPTTSFQDEWRRTGEFSWGGHAFAETYHYGRVEVNAVDWRRNWIRSCCKKDWYEYRISENIGSEEKGKLSRGVTRGRTAHNWYFSNINDLTPLQ